MRIVITEAQAKAIGKLPPFVGNLIVTQEGDEVEVIYAKPESELVVARIAADGKTYS